MSFHRRNPFQDSDKIYAEKPWWSPIEMFVEDGKFVMPKLENIVDLKQPWLWCCVASVLFNPIFWNLVARNEYRNKTLTKIFGSPQRGTNFLAVVIFSLGIVRDFIYKRALDTQPTAQTLSFAEVKVAAMMLFGTGQILVLTSIYQLGIHGTYLGDYFGILMKERVTAFPFNIMENPMYNGSTMCFLATAMWSGKPAGLLITALVYIVYQVALGYEGPFTDRIYSAASKKAATTKTNASASSSSKSKSSKAQEASSGQSFSTSYAAVASQPGQLPSVDPKPLPDLKAVDDPAIPPSSRVTRSRTRAQNIDSD